VHNIWTVVALTMKSAQVDARVYKVLKSWSPKASILIRWCRKQ